MKKLLFILSLCTAINSFAGSLTIYNKSNNTVDVYIQQLNIATRHARPVEGPYTLRPGSHKYIDKFATAVYWHKHGDTSNRNVWGAEVAMAPIETLAEFTIRPEEGLHNWLPWQGQTRQTKLKATKTFEVGNWEAFL